MNGATPLTYVLTPFLKPGLLSLNIDLASVMQAGRWKSHRMPMRYGEHVMAGLGGMARAARAQGRARMSPSPSGAPPGEPRVGGMVQYPLMSRVSVNPDLFRWARDRSRIEPLVLVARFPQLPAWENAEAQPTLRQLENYARATHAPIGFFFLPAPPQESLPIPDFRTVAGRAVARPSPNLLDTIYACQERQSWYREFATVSNQDPRAFVASLTTQTPPADAAASISRALGFDLESRRDCPTWTEALRRFIDQADAIGVLVMVSGVVFNNNRRPLEPEEFRGFALVDSLAPLVFINGADSKAAQMFTLAHELAHLWIGASALSDSTAGVTPDQAIERWCNSVAAELLVPIEALRASLEAGERLSDTLARLARTFKVSTLGILRRL